MSNNSETVSVTRIINVPGPKAWALVTDLPRMGEWSPENQGGQWVKASGPSLGAILKGSNKNGRRKWSTKVRVTEFEPQRRFAFDLVVGGHVMCTWGYEVDDRGSSCEVRHFWVDKRNGFDRRLGKLVSGVSDRAEYNRKNMEITLANLAKSAEA